MMNGRAPPNKFTYKQVDEKSSSTPRRSNCDTCMADRSIIEQSTGRSFEHDMSDHKMAQITIRTEEHVGRDNGDAFREAYQVYKQ